MRLHTDFFDFYPRPHPYIQFYNEFRRMFGSANILSVIVEVKNGDIYNPETLQKLDRITKYIVNTKGVVPYQILSIAHPKVKSITATRGRAADPRDLLSRRCRRRRRTPNGCKFAVYSTKGVRGIFTALDDTAAVVHAGFWEEALDFRDLYERMMELEARRRTTPTTPSTSPASRGCTRRCCSTRTSCCYVFGAHHR